jgi:hypothetical protein
MDFLLTKEVINLKMSTNIFNSYRKSLEEVSQKPKTRDLAKSLNSSRKSSKAENKTRISIDGENQSKNSLAGSTSKIKNYTSQSIKSKNSTISASGYKTKTEFQKRLMSDNNIMKYKANCISILKEDDELKKMCEFLSIMPNQYESLIQENLFADKIFLYKLEQLLLNSQDSSNAPKQKKDKYFQSEIKKFLENKVLDLQYQNKVSSINMHIEKHMKNIMNFEFFK